jgi:hypothetical protein
LPSTICHGRSSVTCSGTRVWRSRSPAIAPDVKPGTRNSTSSSMNRTTSSNIVRPADANRVGESTANGSPFVADSAV